ncbi:hypothetical protein DFJ58DRAFT_916524 [Suillus subalutaceus]|uniref:uncharacterized protein n=1 Tax=Suillus subalutaceus TaxID=48586 RepID=UPI001B887137|nr:uncharacterized protein DFJ58DRAFT_916524 [Suillus subalutaceus]KAG1841231.1 hypothetical protein DFJ58DRAFT_916524 [Suillus subalutaceus]
MSADTLSLPAPSDEQAYIDIKEFAPAATERFSPVVKQTVAESLEAGGVRPSSIDVVVSSHLHWDHVRDPSPFTTAEFVLGEGSKKALEDPGSCHNPEAFSSVRVPEDRLRFITASDLNVAVGPYPRAMDIFGDGSMYIIDASGANSAHHPDLITGKMRIVYCVDANTCSMMCVHEDKEPAEENIRRMRSLLETPRVQVLIAHDIYWYQAEKSSYRSAHIILPLVQ